MSTSQILLFINGVLFMGIALVHMYWAFGGKWAADSVLPQVSSTILVFKPSSLVVFLVAICFLIVAVFYIYGSGLFTINFLDNYRVKILWVLSIGILIRAIGEFKYVGFTKRIKHTNFANYDTKYYSPLCLTMSIFTFLSIYI